MLKQAMMRDVYKRAEEKVKELENQPAAARPTMTQAEKEHSLGAIHRMTSNLSDNPEPTNQALGAAAVAGGMPIPGLLSNSLNQTSRANGRDSYKAILGNVSTLARLPMRTQFAQNMDDMKNAYGQIANFPEDYYRGRLSVPDLESAIAKLRQQSLLDDTGY